MLEHYSFSHSSLLVMLRGSTAQGMMLPHLGWFFPVQLTTSKTLWDISRGSCILNFSSCSFNIHYWAFQVLSLSIYDPNISISHFITWIYLCMNSCVWLYMNLCAIACSGVIGVLVSNTHLGVTLISLIGLEKLCMCLKLDPYILQRVESQLKIDEWQLENRKMNLKMEATGIESNRNVKVPDRKQLLRFWGVYKRSYAQEWKKKDWRLLTENYSCRLTQEQEQQSGRAKEEQDL